MNIDDYADAINAKQLQERGQAVLSPLMRMRKKADPKKLKVNRCPFGCKIRDLDDQAYCRHLVGFAHQVVEGFDKNAIDITAEVMSNGKLRIEPMKKVFDKRKVLVKREIIDTGERNEKGDPITEWGDEIPEFCRTDDTLDRITSCYRVYRDVDKIARDQAAKDQEDARVRDLETKKKELEAREAELAKREAKLTKPKRVMSEEAKAKAKANLEKARAARKAKAGTAG